MKDEELAASLARIEEKLIQIAKSWEDHKVHHFGRNGLDKDVTALGTAIKVMRAKSAQIATIISLIVGLGGWAIFLWGAGYFSR